MAGGAFGSAVGGAGDGGVGDGNRLFAEDIVAFDFFTRAAIDAALFVDLFPIDCIALREPEAAVDRQRGAGVPYGVAAGIGGDVAGAVEWRADDGDCTIVYGDGAAGGGDFLMSWRGGGEAGGDAMGEFARPAFTFGQLKMDEEEGLRAFGEGGGWFARADWLETSGDFFGIEGL